MTTTKPFDPTKPVMTRDGRKARIVCTDRAIVCTDRATDYSIVCLITNSDGRELVSTRLSNGQLIVTKEGPADLVNVPERRSYWFNVYRSFLSPPYVDRVDAENNGTRSRKGTLELVFDDETGEYIETIYHKIESTL